MSMPKLFNDEPVFRKMCVSAWKWGTDEAGRATMLQMILDHLELAATEEELKEATDWLDEAFPTRGLVLVHDPKAHLTRAELAERVLDRINVTARYSVRGKGTNTYVDGVLIAKHAKKADIEATIRHIVGQRVVVDPRVKDGTKKDPPKFQASDLAQAGLVERVNDAFKTRRGHNVFDPFQDYQQGTFEFAHLAGRSPIDAWQVIREMAPEWRRTETYQAAARYQTNRVTERSANAGFGPEYAYRDSHADLWRHHVRLLTQTAVAQSWMDESNLVETVQGGYFVLYCGPGGAFKSTLATCLLPPVSSGDVHKSETQHGSRADYRSFLEDMHSYVFYEIGEMLGFKSDDDFKSFVLTASDSWNEKYQDGSFRNFRRCCIYGTMNSQKLPFPSEGPQRRIFVVHVDRDPGMFQTLGSSEDAGARDMRLWLDQQMADGNGNPILSKAGLPICRREWIWGEALYFHFDLQMPRRFGEAAWHDPYGREVWGPGARTEVERVSHLVSTKDNLKDAIYAVLQNAAENGNPNLIKNEILDLAGYKERSPFYMGAVDSVIQGIGARAALAGVDPAVVADAIDYQSCRRGSDSRRAYNIQKIQAIDPNLPEPADGWRKVFAKGRWAPVDLEQPSLRLVGEDQ